MYVPSWSFAIHATDVTSEILGYLNGCLDTEAGGLLAESGLSSLAITSRPNCLGSRHHMVEEITENRLG